MAGEELTVHDLLADASLVAISNLALSAERNEIDALEREEISPTYALDLDVREGGKEFRVALDVRIETGVGDIRAKVAVEYNLDELSIESTPIDAVEEFVNNVAIMVVLPFVRQSIADLTQRVFDSALIMPIIPRGQIEFSLSSGD